MSSTTCVCDCDDFYCCRTLENMQEPWYDYYHNMGQPLIYYSTVQPSFRRSRSGVRKRSPNFFVKAFRWYTQEHHPEQRCHEKAGTTPDFTNFANWLDNKYGQYIQENQQLNQYTYVQSSGRNESNVFTEPQKPKKLFATMKRHFKKRSYVKGNIDNRDKSYNSCESIMPPKQMSVTASEHRRGNIKAVCSDTVAQKKSALKSVSATSSRVYDVDYQKSIEIVVTEGAVNEKPQEKCSCTNTEIVTIYESKQNNLYDVSNKRPRKNKDVECQCDVISITKSDAQTQYDKDINAVTETTRTEKQPQQDAKIPKIGSKNNYYSNNRCSPMATNVKLHKDPQVSSISCQCSFEHEAITNETTPKPVYRKVAQTSNVSCQCPIEYEPPTAPKSFNECTCTRSFQDTIRAIYQQNKAMIGQYKEEQEQIPAAPPVMNNIQPASPVKAAMTPVPSMTAVPSTHFVARTKSEFRSQSRVNETVQTSNHSICLDDEVAKYPFFLKIVRADKLVVN